MSLICFLTIWNALKIPSIVTVHGTIHWDAPHLDDYTPPILRSAKRTLEKQVAKYITYFIAISGHVRDVLINKLNIPNSKIGVVYLPIDHTTFKQLNYDVVKRVKEKYDIRSRYVLHVSAFSRRKNPKVIFKAFHIVKKQIRDIVLVIAGPGWLNQFVQKLIKEIGLQESVKILEWIPKEDLVALYNGAEVLLFPSLHENFGFPIVEAMACGCPVVTSNVYAIPEIADNAAILCDPHDYECFANAVLEVLLNNELREELVRKGLERAKLFEWSSHLSRVLDIYVKAINKFNVSLDEGSNMLMNS
jgi:glycosyltransferase involved in cell wall biosynthesis